MPLASANADVFPCLACFSPATTTITTTTTTTTHDPNPPRLDSASAGWPKAPAVKTSRPPFPVSYTATKSPRGWIASKSSRRCRIVSGNIPTFTARVSLRISYLGPSDLIRLSWVFFSADVEIEDEEPLGQPTSTDGPGPLSAGTVSGSPLPKDHPDQKNVPKPPTDDHPNTPQRLDTHLNNPAKGKHTVHQFWTFTWSSKTSLFANITPPWFFTL
jgi:hypothetical protein